MPRDHRPAKSIRVLLAEDPGMTRGALALLLGMEPDLTVVAQVSAGEAIVDAALTYRPDVALLDVELPGRSGLDIAAELRDQAPDCRVLLLTTHGRPGHLHRAMAAGAAGFLVKDAPMEELATAIRRVLTGETVIDPALAATAHDATGLGATSHDLTALDTTAHDATALDATAPAVTALDAEPNPLTAQERDVLRASADGATITDVAAQLHLPEPTVRECLSYAVAKTGTSEQTAALREAQRQGWL
ncbi:two-component system, NarL family, response regulator DesR [Streptomyces sp. cf386]|uniref:response regulator transcription factor n=1 Tax=Streptomyces sp. cf386 TaxID=1761904 RepID=UPI000880CF91|nr:response regulator [Streptomyces sp. cf386]SDO23520.1 two-component system, NarL family, response regulator DesR [Streptomyces sp. cf386]